MSTVCGPRQDFEAARLCRRRFKASQGARREGRTRKSGPKNKGCEASRGAAAGQQGDSTARRKPEAGEDSAAHGGYLPSRMGPARQAGAVPAGAKDRTAITATDRHETFSLNREATSEGISRTFRINDTRWEPSPLWALGNLPRTTAIYQRPQLPVQLLEPCCTIRPTFARCYPFTSLVQNAGRTTYGLPMLC
jgi:hypothetical protein